jgi:peroxiredoxin
MIELGKLEANHEKFKRRNAQVVVVSLEGPEDAQETKKDFDHLVVVADKERGLTSKVEVIHKHSAPDGGDTSAPTTILIDRHGIVRWLYRPDRFFRRLAPEEVLEAMDKYLASKGTSSGPES